MSNDKMREALKASECLYAWALSPNVQPTEKIVEKFQLVRTALTQQPSRDPAIKVVVGEDGNPKSITPEFGISELGVGTHYLYAAPSIAEKPAAAPTAKEGFELLMRDITEQLPFDPDHDRAICVNYDWLYERTRDAFGLRGEVGVPSIAEKRPQDLDIWKTESLRQYMHNDGSGFVFAYDKEAVDDLLGTLSKRGGGEQ